LFRRGGKCLIGSRKTACFPLRIFVRESPRAKAIPATFRFSTSAKACAGGPIGSADNAARLTLFLSRQKSPLLLINSENAPRKTGAFFLLTRHCVSLLEPPAPSVFPLRPADFASRRVFWLAVAGPANQLRGALCDWPVLALHRPRTAASARGGLGLPWFFGFKNTLRGGSALCIGPTSVVAACDLADRCRRPRRSPDGAKPAAPILTAP